MGSVWTDSCSQLSQQQVLNPGPSFHCFPRTDVTGVCCHPLCPVYARLSTMHSGGLGYIGKSCLKTKGQNAWSWQSRAENSSLGINGHLWCLSPWPPVNILHSSGPALSPENSGLHHKTSGTPDRECVEARDPAQDLVEMIGRGAHSAQAALSSPVL